MRLPSGAHGAQDGDRPETPRGDTKTKTGGEGRGSPPQTLQCLVDAAGFQAAPGIWSTVFDQITTSNSLSTLQLAVPAASRPRGTQGRGAPSPSRLWRLLEAGSPGSASLTFISSQPQLEPTSARPEQPHWPPWGSPGHLLTLHPAGFLWQTPAWVKWEGPVCGLFHCLNKNAGLLMKIKCLGMDCSILQNLLMHQQII